VACNVGFVHRVTNGIIPQPHASTKAHDTERARPRRPGPSKGVCGTDVLPGRPYARPSASYSRRKPSNILRCSCSPRRIAMTMSLVTGSESSVTSTILV
jgi:hypothetical protein